MSLEQSLENLNSARWNPLHVPLERVAKNSNASGENRRHFSREESLWLSFSLDVPVISWGHLAKELLLSVGLLGCHLMGVARLWRRRSTGLPDPLPGRIPLAFCFQYFLYDVVLVRRSDG